MEHLLPLPVFSSTGITEEDLAFALDWLCRPPPTVGVTEAIATKMAKERQNTTQHIHNFFSSVFARMKAVGAMEPSYFKALCRGKSLSWCFDMIDGMTGFSAYIDQFSTVTTLSEEEMLLHRVLGVHNSIVYAFTTPPVFINGKMYQFALSSGVRSTLHLVSHSYTRNPRERRIAKRAVKNAYNSPRSNKECPVCLESVESPGVGTHPTFRGTAAVDGCEHLFHSKCLLEWVDKSSFSKLHSLEEPHTPGYPTQCPMCRGGVSGISMA